MPYFKWHGVTIIGQNKRGYLFAQSKDHLAQQLLKRHVALLNCKSTRMRSFFSRITTAHKIGFFRQFCVLVSSGVLLPDALAIVADQINHARLQEIIHTLSDSVRQGTALNVAMQKYPQLCDAMIIQLIHVGEESGNLSAVLESLCVYLETKRDFYRRIRAALLMPCITFIFFLLIAAVIFMVVIPRFADMFATFNQELPTITRVLIAVSNMLLSWRIMWIAGIFLISLLCAKIVALTKYGKRFIDFLMVYMPLIGPIVRYRFLAHTFESVGLLLTGGMRLVPTLHTVKNTVKNDLLRDYVQVIINEITAGSSLADACAYHPNALCTPDIIAMMHVGQEIGNLDLMLQQIAVVYYERVKQRLLFLTTILQPLLLIILGLLITALIFAIYIPILNISYVM